MNDLLRSRRAPARGRRCAPRPDGCAPALVRRTPRGALPHDRRPARDGQADRAAADLRLRRRRGLGRGHVAAQPHAVRATRRCSRARSWTSPRSRCRRPCSGARSRCRSSPPPTGMTGLTHPDGESGDRARGARRGHDLHAVGALLALDRGGLRGRAGSEVVPALRDERPRARATNALARGGHGLRGAGADGRRAVAGMRERDVRNRFSVPPRMTARTLRAGRRRPRWSRGLPRPPADDARQPRLDGAAPQATPQCGQPLVRPDRDLGRPRAAPRAVGRPAADQGHHAPGRRGAAVEHGVEGIIVSNHGGRQLDHARRRSRRCRRSRMPSATAPSSTSTAASAAARTSSRRSRSARGRC